MALSANNGSEYYAISCGVPSTTTDLSSNNFTGYYHLSVNDFILWGQESTYPPITANNGTQYYFLECDVPSTSGINLESNNFTGYYYNSAFNCVAWCEGMQNDSDISGNILNYIVIGTLGDNTLLNINENAALNYTVIGTII